MTETANAGVKNEDKRGRLLRQLGVSHEAVAQEIQLTAGLKENGISPADVIGVFRSDSDPESQTVVALWDSLTPANQGLIGLEALALAAGLSTARLWGLFCGACAELWWQVGRYERRRCRAFHKLPD